MHPCPRFMFRRTARRAFTLVELMVVVMLVGILATVGIVLFRQWVFHSRSVEAIGMLQSIRVAQERWRSETGAYMDVSDNMAAWYPTTTPNRTLYAWKQVSGNDYAKWMLLNPTVSGPVQFAYVTKAGPPGTAMPDPETVDKPTWPQATDMTQPWFVIQAMGDTDADGVKSYYVAASLNGEIYKEQEGE
ncbi:MAG: prepilin-type N-terminal cleavage/methylation domain-containing protein [Myxococcales bacterium]|nr:prepilin-type N-terminal cleavage/methylation domain-containing protein [Myxococcales bacterium]